MKNMLRKMIALILGLSMVLSCVPAFASEGAKWTEQQMPDGWIKVTNEGGKTLGYWPDSGVTILEDDGFAFKDMNQNGELDVYEDWRLDYTTRAANLAELMEGTDEAKFLMFLSSTGVESNVSLGEAMTNELTLGFRTFSTRAGSVKDSVKIVNMLQSYAEGLPFGIPVDLRGDIGNSLTSKWPSQLGMAASFDPDIVAQFNRLYSSELRDIGLTTLHHPQMDLVSEPRWSRITATFGEHPQMTSDMGAAATNALQSTYDAEGNDLGWGDDSCNALVKHFPGDGAGESGRESHHPGGKYEVFPGFNFETHVGIYEKALTNLDGLTGRSAGVMTNYSASVNGDGTPIGDEIVATAYSEYKQIGLLRERFDWDGIICTDWSILDITYWGMEDYTIPQRLVKTLEAGSDRIEKFNVVDDILAGFALYEAKYGEDETIERIAASGTRLIRSFMQLGLFENPYLDLEESTANVASADKVEAGYQAMLKSVVMLKNAGNLIHQKAETEKPTVYIPMIYTAATARAGASLKPCIDVDIASAYFNVVTDKLCDPLTGPADAKGQPTASPNDVIRASEEEIAACDFALVYIKSPANTCIGTGESRPGPGQQGYDYENEQYIPISLQYRPYTADSEFVRKESIAGDMIEGDAEALYQDDYYGQTAPKVKENRSYFGNTGHITNEADLDLVLQTAELCDHVITVVNASNPFIVKEFEDKVDALLVHFGNLDVKAILDIVSGTAEPSALLPVQMPANMDTVEAQLEDVPFDMECYVDAEGNTYDFGFGLNWSGVISDERIAKYAKP